MKEIEFWEETFEDSKLPLKVLGIVNKDTYTAEENIKVITIRVAGYLTPTPYLIIYYNAMKEIVQMRPVRDAKGYTYISTTYDEDAIKNRLKEFVLKLT